MAAIGVVACVASFISCVAFSETTLLKSEFFSLKVDSAGQQVCSTEITSEELFAASNSECAFACAAEIKCIHYSYLKKKSLCQLFYYNPKSFTKTDGCKSYTNTVKNVTDLH